jgi:methionine-S-sulfoxide reductase
VVRTRVGYAGGQKKNPTYYFLGDHTETLQLDFDPQEITYAELLDVFWKTHNPCARAGNRQYMSAIFYHNDEQRRLALATRDQEATRRRATITTQILPLAEFYLAEPYHQKYMLRQQRVLMREFQSMYPDDMAFVNSTAATRVNGYLGGNGSQEKLKSEIDSLGLSAAGRQVLVQSIQR